MPEKALCLQSIRKRIGKKRFVLPWTEEKPDPDFESYVRKFESDKVPEIKKALEYAKILHNKVVEFQDRKQAERWLENLPEQRIE